MGIDFSHNIVYNRVKLRRKEDGLMKKLIRISAVLISLLMLSSVFTVTAFAESKLLVHGKFNFDFANEMTEYINEYRVKNGLNKLESDFSLVEPAMIRAAECNVQFSHTRPNTRLWMTVMDWEDAAAENIAVGFSNPREATDGYYNSEGHRINMLGDYTRVGVGVFTADNGYNYWIHAFTCGKPQQTYKETGVRTVNVNIATDPDDETTISYVDGQKTPSEKAFEYEKSKAPTIASVSFSDSTLEYNGKNQAPKVVARDENGEVVSKDYYKIILPKKHKDFGTYKMAVEPKYGGKDFTFKFSIIPKGTSISRLTKTKKSIIVRWRSAASSVTGVKVVYANNKSFSGNKVLTLSRTKTLKSIKGLKNGKTYYFKIRTYKTKGSTTYYSDWSKVKKIKK